MSGADKGDGRKNTHSVESMTKYYFERALFVGGEQNAGKSTQLRSMLSDVRFHTFGKVASGADSRKLPAAYRFSNERVLYLRLTPPHEYGDDLQSFFETIESNI